MRHLLVPIPCKPWALNGLSERLIVSHYENEYGAAVQSLNAIRGELDALDFTTATDFHLRALKREELAAENSVLLHELYFGSLGGDGATLFTGTGRAKKIDGAAPAALERDFGGMAEWRRQFVALAGALRHGSGWALLLYSRRAKRLLNQVAADHSHAMIDGAPLLALDMHEHAYHLDFGANVSAYIDAFMRNIDWGGVSDRLDEASGGHASSKEKAATDQRPSVSVEELAADLAQQRPVQVLDVRPKHYFSRSPDMMKHATWRDPDGIDQWSKDLSPDEPVVVHCAYGYAVGCDVAEALRERGFDAKYVRGGLSAWYAAGGERVLKPGAPATSS